MPDFGSPFPGLTLDRKLSKDELVRAIKFMIAAELEATQMYDQVAEATTDKAAQKLIRDISDEERVHAGEFSKLLFEVDPKEAELIQKGMQEAEEKMGKKSVAGLLRVMAKKINEGSYEWQKTEKGDAKTLMFKSPSTGKKFHVSPSASTGKITFDQYGDFKRDFDKNKRKSPLRLGQAFCNKFGITDSKLFYEKNEKKAEEMIWSTHLVIDKPIFERLVHRVFK